MSEYFVRVGGIANSRSGEANHLFALHLLNQFLGFSDVARQLVNALLGQVVVLIQVLDQLHRRLGIAHRSRMSAPAGVHHHQVDGITTYI